MNEQQNTKTILCVEMHIGILKGTAKNDRGLKCGDWYQMILVNP